MGDDGEPKIFDPNDPDIRAKDAPPIQPAASRADAADQDRQTAGVADPGAADLSRLGADLALAMQEDRYHPVILFGTNFSGKTSLLLSLFSTLTSESRLKASLFLRDPILGPSSGIGQRLHTEALHTFDVKTQAFIEGEKIPKTNVSLPFFIPVELRPDGKPVVRFAFLESNGEWYRPHRERGRLANAERLYPGLKAELETFIMQFQGPITFIYLAPYTQREVFAERDEAVDGDELQNASLAIAGVIRTYDRVRNNYRADDRHLMLVTKWDAHSNKDSDRAGGIEEDREELVAFCNRRYAQAQAAFQGLMPRQRQLNAYSSGIIGERGLLQQRQDGDVHAAIMSYPIRLWTWLYGNGLEAVGEARQPPFPQPPQPPALVRLFRQILDFVSAR